MPRQRGLECNRLVSTDTRRGLCGRCYRNPEVRLVYPPLGQASAEPQQGTPEPPPGCPGGPAAVGYTGPVPARGTAW